MAKLLGKQYTKEALLKYTGNPSQIAGVTSYTLDDGKGRGMRVYKVRNANGLAFDLMPDKGFDIGSLTFKGINIAFQTKNGISSAGYGYPVLNEFDRYFSGGMLMTCGLKNTGPDYIDQNGFFQHVHGRVGITPTEQSWAKSYWKDDEYVIAAGGVVRDSVLGGHNLTLNRTITTSVSKNEIHITDVLENHEPDETEYLILYHFNFGFPFISEQIKLGFPDSLDEIRPRTQEAETGINEWHVMTEPVDNEPEQVFFHSLKPDDNGRCSIRLENPALGIGTYLHYDKTNLPILTQWKSLRSGEYVLGIEPGNSYISGMENEKKNGRVDTIKPFSTKTFDMVLGFYDIE